MSATYTLKVRETNKYLFSTHVHKHTHEHIINSNVELPVVTHKYTLHLKRSWIIC